MAAESEQMIPRSRGKNVLLGIIMLSSALIVGLLWKCLDLKGRMDQAQTLEVLALGQDRARIIGLLGNPEAEFASPEAISGGGYKPVKDHGEMSKAGRFLLYRSAWALNTQLIVGVDESGQVVYLGHWAT